MDVAVCENLQFGRLHIVSIYCSVYCDNMICMILIYVLKILFKFFCVCSS